MTHHKGTHQMKGQSEIAYLPKFADLYVKLCGFLIASPISYILTVDRFSSSNFDRAIAVQSFDLFSDLLTSSTKQSKIVCKRIFTTQWYICTLSLKMISLFVLQLSWKMLFFSFIKEYRKTTLRSLCDVIYDVIAMKIFSLAWFGMMFSFLMSNWGCV